MPMHADEFNAIMLSDKRIEGSIDWHEDQDRSQSARIFRADVITDDERSMFVHGRYNARRGKLTYALILRGEGRIYELDMGREHRPYPDKHKHSNDEVYDPADITAPLTEPTQVWEQFCREARITHIGNMAQPPQIGIQRNLT